MTRPTRAAAHSPAPRPDAAETWPAPVARGPVRGEVRLPGSKSLTNRHLVLAALADGPCVLHGVLGRREVCSAADEDTEDRRYQRPQRRRVEGIGHDPGQSPVAVGAP